MRLKTHLLPWESNSTRPGSGINLEGNLVSFLIPGSKEGGVNLEVAGGDKGAF